MMIHQSSLASALCPWTAAVNPAGQIPNKLEHDQFADSNIDDTTCKGCAKDAPAIQSKSRRKPGKAPTRAGWEENPRDLGRPFAQHGFRLQELESFRTMVERALAVSGTKVVEHDALAAPPLVEALCELNFESAPPWNWTIPGQLRERLGAAYGEVEEVGAPAAGSGMGGVAVAPLRIRLRDGAHGRIVQSGPELLAINQMAPYPGWSSFRAEIHRVFGLHREIAPGSVPVQITLRYINRIPLKGATVELADYSTLTPPLRGCLDRPVLSLSQRISLEHSSGVLSIWNRVEGDGMMLDLQFSTGGEDGRQVPVAPVDVLSWLDEAHEHLYSAFKDSVTGAVFDGFKGGKE